MRTNNLYAKALNAMVTGDNFTNKNLDNYLYASLSQPPIKIIDKCGSDDELDYIVECPTCGSHVKYGTSMYMLSGHMYCDKQGCREKLTHLLGIRR